MVKLEYLFPSFTGWMWVWLHYSEHMATLTYSNGLNLEWYILCYYFSYLFYIIILFIYFIYYFIYLLFVSSKANICKLWRVYLIEPLNIFYTMLLIIFVERLAAAWDWIEWRVYLIEPLNIFYTMLLIIFVERLAAWDWIEWRVYLIEPLNIFYTVLLIIFVLCRKIGSSMRPNRMKGLSHRFTKYFLHYASHYICRKIGSSMRLNILYIGGWRPLFSKKMVSAAHFPLKSAAQPVAIW